MVLCRIGLHGWSFKSFYVAEQDFSAHTELVFARCRREGCAQGAWVLVNIDVYAAATAPRAARGVAKRIGRERPLSA